jgi:hypothetical protein
MVTSGKIGGRGGKGPLSSKVDDGAVAVAADEEAIRMTELSELVEAGLGGPLDRPTFDALAVIQMRLRRTQAELVSSLDRGRISPEKYLEDVTAALRTASLESQKLLGRARFLAIFGEAGLQPEGMIDRDAFVAQQRRR